MPAIKRKMAKVVNIRDKKQKKEMDIYVGRSGYGVDSSFLGGNGFWGNPTFDIIKHRYYLFRIIRDCPEFLNYLIKNLRGKVLGCWCVPKDCHANLYFRLANRGGNVESAWNNGMMEMADYFNNPKFHEEINKIEKGTDFSDIQSKIKRKIQEFQRFNDLL